MIWSEGWTAWTHGKVPPREWWSDLGITHLWLSGVPWHFWTLEGLASLTRAGSAWGEHLIAENKAQRWIGPAWFGPAANSGSAWQAACDSGLAGLSVLADCGAACAFDVEPYGGDGTRWPAWKREAAIIRGHALGSTIMGAGVQAVYVAAVHGWEREHAAYRGLGQGLRQQLGQRLTWSCTDGYSPGTSVGPEAEELQREGYNYRRLLRQVRADLRAPKLPVLVWLECRARDEREPELLVEQARSARALGCEVGLWSNAAAPWERPELAALVRQVAGGI